jgi:hypothetical protein
MELSLPLQAASHSATVEFPNILWNLEVTMFTGALLCSHAI